MKNKALAFVAPAALLLLASAGPAHARGGIEVRAVSPPLIEAGPGEIAALSFRVANRAGEEVELLEDFLLPEGWRPLMPPLLFRLGPGRETTRLLAFQVPAGTPAGDYGIAWGAISPADYSLADSAALVVSVRAFHELELILEGRAPETVVAGDSFRVSARLVNRGNAALQVEVEARLTGRGEASVSPAALRLETGETRLLEVTARPDPDQRMLARRHLRLVARGDREIDGRTVSARLTVPFDLVPLVSGEDPLRRFPMEFSTRLAGDGSRSGFQLGLRGDGWLDEARTRRLDFSVQGPDRRGRGFLGRRDEYRARYREPLWSARAGDTIFSLSPLTSWSRYGRGLAFELHPPENTFRAGAYFAGDRWREQVRRDAAAWLAFEPGRHSLRLNLVSLDYKPWQADPGGRDGIASVQGDFRPRGEDRLSAEIAFSESARRNGATGGAWRLEYRNPATESTRYSLAARRSGADFAGRHEDSASYSAGITLPLAETLRGELSFRRDERNLAAIPERGAATRENLYRAGLAWRLPARWRLNLGYFLQDWSDALSPPAFESRRQGVHLGAGRSAGAFSYHATARRSWSEDLLDGTSHGRWSGNLNTSWRPNPAFSLSLRAGLGREDAPDGSTLARQANNFGASADWKPTGTFSARLHYARHARSYPDEPLRERVESDQYGISLGWRLAGDRRFDLGVRRRESNSGDAQTYYYATLALPFGPSIGRRQSVGSLEGRVYLADEPGGPGVAGAVVLVDGTAAVTGPDGQFAFHTLPPGEYMLRVEELSVGIGRVPANDESRAVTVTGRKTARMDIGLVRTGSVAGRIMVEPTGNDYNNNFNNNTAGGPGNGNNNFISGANGTGNVNGGFISGGGNNNMLNNRPGQGNENGNGAGNILLELSREGETRRTVSDSRGSFLFERLRPGEWTLRVYPHNLPAFHEIDAAERPVTVAPGDQAEVTVRVTPRRREIRFIDEGRIGTNNNN